MAAVYNDLRPSPAKTLGYLGCLPFPMFAILLEGQHHMCVCACVACDPLITALWLCVLPWPSACLCDCTESATSSGFGQGFKPQVAPLGSILAKLQAKQAALGARCV